LSELVEQLKSRHRDSMDGYVYLITVLDRVSCRILCSGLELNYELLPKQFADPSMIPCVISVSLVGMLGYLFLVPLLGMSNLLISGPPMCSMSLVTSTTRSSLMITLTTIVSKVSLKRRLGAKAHWCSEASWSP
jgi:hypothetical protein